MTIRFVRMLWLLALLAATACQAGDSGYNSAIEGVVLEEGTNKPIAGAFVIAEWTHYSGYLIGTSTNCARIEIVRTDEQGRFKIPSVFIGTLLGRVDRSVTAYQPGLEEVWKENMTAADYLIFERQKTMRPYRGTGLDRLLELQKMRGLSCG